MEIFRGSDFVAIDFLDEVGAHVLSGIVDVGTVYRLRASLNAVTSAIRTTGSADALATLEIHSISAQPVPEPGTGILLALGLTGLATSRGGRRGRQAA